MATQNALRTREENNLPLQLLYINDPIQIKLPNPSTGAHLFLSYHLLKIPSIKYTGPDTGVFPCFMLPKI